MVQSSAYGFGLLGDVVELEGESFVSVQVRCVGIVIYEYMEKGSDTSKAMNACAKCFLDESKVHLMKKSLLAQRDDIIDKTVLCYLTGNTENKDLQVITEIVAFALDTALFGYFGCQLDNILQEIREGDK